MWTKRNWGPTQVGSGKFFSPYPSRPLMRQERLLSVGTDGGGYIIYYVPIKMISLSPAPVDPAAFNLPRHMCTIRRTHEHGRSLVLVVRMPPQEEQHTDALTARLAGMLLGALLRDVLAREAWTRFPARCFGSPASCLGSPTADTLRVVHRSYTAVFQPHRASRLCPR